MERALPQSVVYHRWNKNEQNCKYTAYCGKKNLKTFQFSFSNVTAQKMSSFFTAHDLPSSFFVYTASHKSATNDHLNKSYSFSNWLYLNDNSDLRQFNVGLAEIYYGDSFELPSATTTPSTDTGKTLEIKLHQKQKVEISFPKEIMDLSGLLSAITTKLSLTLKTVKIETVHYGDGIPDKTQIKFPAVEGESYFVELDTNLASVLGFRNTVFPAGTHVSEDPQSTLVYNKLETATIFRIDYFKWKESTITITNDSEDGDDSLENWLEICTRSLENAGYPIYFVLSAYGETLFVQMRTTGVKFTLPKQINAALGLDDGYEFTKSIPVQLIYHKTADRELNLVYVTADLVRPSQLGEQFHPILRVFPRKEGISTKHHIVFDPVFYQPVASAVPNLVHIGLKNQFFNHLPHSDSPTIAVLHFKRIAA